MSFLPSITDVAISEFIIRYEPSPTMTNTSRSGAAIFTPRPTCVGFLPPESSLGAAPLSSVRSMAVLKSMREPLKAVVLTLL